MEIKMTGTPEEIAKLLQAIGSSEEQKAIKGDLLINEKNIEEISVALGSDIDICSEF